LFELMVAGGWLMWPIAACSVIAMAIVVERAWVLRRSRIVPEGLLTTIWQLHRRDKLTGQRIEEIREGSPLGRILAAALANREHSRDVMKEAITDTGRLVVGDLERYLNTLGTIAAIAPLLGLLGTVFGMIQIFDVIKTAGNGNVGLLAGGISVALITTAAGLCVAIPALMFHRYFDGLVDKLALEMEELALRLVEVINGQREEEEDQA
jgi:biopolymer transport protein ExbB